MEGEQEEAAVLPGSPAPRCHCWGDSSASLGPRFSLYYRGGTGCKTARNCNKTPRRRGYGSRLLHFPGNCRIGGAAGAEKITRGQGGASGISQQVDSSPRAGALLSTRVKFLELLRDKTQALPRPAPGSPRPLHPGAREGLVPWPTHGDGDVPGSVKGFAAPQSIAHVGPGSHPTEPQWDPRTPNCL